MLLKKAYTPFNTLHSCPKSPPPPLDCLHSQPFVSVRRYVEPSLSEISPRLTAWRCSRWSGSSLSNTGGVSHQNRKTNKRKVRGILKKKVRLIFTSHYEVMDQYTIVDWRLRFLHWWPEGCVLKFPGLWRDEVEHIIWCQSTSTPDVA